PDVLLGVKGFDHVLGFRAGAPAPSAGRAGAVCRGWAPGAAIAHLTAPPDRQADHAPSPPPPATRPSQLPFRHGPGNHSYDQSWSNGCRQGAIALVERRVTFPWLPAFQFERCAANRSSASFRRAGIP